MRLKNWGLFIIPLLLAPSLLQAQTFCVATVNDLYDALAIAASNKQHDEIRIVQGTYKDNFVFASNEAFNLTLKGGYVKGCASRVVKASNTVFDGNQKGRVLKLNNVQKGNFVVDGLTLKNGKVSGSGGGLSINTNKGKVTLSNNTLTGNAASADGGGVEIQNSETVTVTKNTISNNTASDDGGGVSFYRGTNTLSNNTISNNTASDEGGGVYFYRGINTLTNNTITANKAKNNGGGILSYLYYDSEKTDIYNNIIYKNTAPIGSDIYINNDGNGNDIPTPVKLFNNDFNKTRKTGIYTKLPIAIDASNLNNLNPLFVSATNLHLKAGSPVINKGNNKAPKLPPKDKDGKARIINKIVDMGAYEYQTVIPCKYSINPTSRNHNGKAGTGSVTSFQRLAGIRWQNFFKF
jgi:parallel beta-helix repeat protein